MVIQGAIERARGEFIDEKDGCSQLRIDRMKWLERIDQMIMNYEARRIAALRELDRHHHASIAEALRRATDNVIDTEFEYIPSAQRNVA